MKITIIGTGAYSFGIALQLSKNKNNKIILWSENKDYINEFKKTHMIKSIYNDIKLPNNVSITGDYKKALDNCEIIYLIPAAKYIKSICENIKEYYNNQVICIASKGIDHESLLPLSTVVKNTLNTKNVTVISGPTFAVDLVHNEPAALAIGGYNKKSINIIKNNLENETLKLRVSSDIIGIQLCGSIKNIIAIASGILNGLGYSESTQAFLINESLHDMKKIISVLGGKKKTILSFAGIGDLLLTCFSTKSRNYSFGYVIGSTKDSEKIKEYLDNNTTEGYYSLNSIYKMLQKKGIDIPLITLIKNIIDNKNKPEDLVSFLINKD